MGSVRSAMDSDSAPPPLHAEVEQLRVMALRERAVAEGVPEDAVEDAMEAEDTKGALIGLMLEVASSRAPEDRLLSTLRAGEQTVSQLERRL